LVCICVGTTNKCKIEGIRKAFLKFYGTVTLRSFNVDSGVPPQPLGLEQIFVGARNRALNSLSKCGECVFGVGVEAGIFNVFNTYFDVQVAAIADRSNEITYGMSPSFPIPRSFINKLLRGESRELEDLVNEYYGTKRIGEEGGFIKLLTKSVVTREDLTYYAVVMALVPRLNTNLYFSR